MQFASGARLEEHRWRFLHKIQGRDMTSLSWSKLLNAERFSAHFGKAKAGKNPNAPGWLISNRTALERDFDRILFSTPTRRLGDKTQVFPREKNESVRNRLTHTHEVVNLARSAATFIVHGDIGKRITFDLGGDSNAEELMRRGIPAMLTAAALAHDLGNPPFGHQGEEAIRAWVESRAEELFGGVKMPGGAIVEPPLTEPQRKDFLKFEGNAQTLRVVTRLQVVGDDLGLNLTFGTLAAIMKYTGSADEMDRSSSNAALKKVGHYQSERNIVATVRSSCGLPEYVRHPLTYIMEACDDIAYTVLDAEDTVKKQIVSFSDVLAWISSGIDDEATAHVHYLSSRDHASLRDTTSLSPAEQNDITMQRFRVHSIYVMMSALLTALNTHYDAIMRGEFSGNLLDESPAAKLIKRLKQFDALHAYRNRRVRELELEGFNVLHGLMDLLWKGIVSRPAFEDLQPKRRNTPFASYAYDRISENYRRVFEQSYAKRFRSDEPDLPIRYRELQLLTDMVSGMTDEYAIELHEELRSYHVGASAH